MEGDGALVALGAGGDDGFRLAGGRGLGLGVFPRRQSRLHLAFQPAHVAGLDPPQREQPQQGGRQPGAQAQPPLTEQRDHVAPSAQQQASALTAPSRFNHPAPKVAKCGIAR